MEFPRRESEFAATDTGFRVVLKRNCSISPRGLLLVYALLAAIAVGIASGFAVLGAWLILPFAGLELALLLGGTKAHRRTLQPISLAIIRTVVPRAVTSAPSAGRGCARR